MCFNVKKKPFPVLSTVEAPLFTPLFAQSALIGQLLQA